MTPREREINHPARGDKRKAAVLEAELATNYAGVSAEDLAERLRLAARSGDLDLLHELIAAGADLNRADGNGRTALMLASQNDHERSLLALVAAGAELEKVDLYSWTALKFAYYNGRGACTRALINAGAANNIPACV